MKLVQQISPISCVHACLAMVTGRSIKSIIYELGHSVEGLNFDDEILFYHKHKMPFNHLTRTTLFNGTYLITVPSLSGDVPVKHHRIVVVCKDGEPKVFDPMKGRGNYYSKKTFMQAFWSEIIQIA